MEADAGVENEKPLSECDRRIFEANTCSIVERAVAILTAIPLKEIHKAGVNYGFRTVAWEIDANTLTNLLAQICSPTLRDECPDWEHRSSGDAFVSLCPL